MQHRFLFIEGMPVPVLRLCGGRGAAAAANLLAARSVADPGAAPQRAAVPDRGGGVGAAGLLGALLRSVEAARVEAC